MDTLFRRGPSHAVADRRKMGESQRRVEEGGFEGGGVVDNLTSILLFSDTF